MLHYIHAAITDSREMPTHLAITCSDLIALLEDLDEFVKTEKPSRCGTRWSMIRGTSVGSRGMEKFMSGFVWLTSWTR